MSARLRAFLLVVLLIGLGWAGLAMVTRLRHPMRVPSRGRVLVFDVPSDVDEAPPTYGAFSFGSLRRLRPTLFEYTDAIRRAADDDDIKALALHVDGVGWGWARIAEMRDAITAFRATGKPVDVSLSGGGEAEYLLVCGASRVAMPPTATLQLDGLSASAMFYKGAYDKLGIHPNYQHVGQFKSAVEQYTRTDLSPEGRAALDAMLDDEYRLLLDTLAVARRVAPDSMRRLIDNGPFTADEAIASGLVDTLLDRAELDSMAAGGHARRLATTTMERYLESPGGSGVRSNEFAMIVASGTIVPGRSRETPFGGPECGSETIVGALREAQHRGSVKAIILRVDSPGGSGQASDDVWREVRRVRRLKPVVVSMSNLAASGGYYIACGADAIVAEPSTITGSIGVFSGKLNILGLYRKLGLNVETLSRGKHAEMLSPYKDFTPEEAERFQRGLEVFYRTFVGRVAESRHLSAAHVDSIGQGHVWTGLAAAKLGLVDSLGGLDAAVSLARARAGLAPDADVDLELYPRPRRSMLVQVFENLLDEQPEDSGIRALPPFDRAPGLPRTLSPVLRAWLAAGELPAGTALALLPVSIEFH